MKTKNDFITRSQPGVNDLSGEQYGPGAVETVSADRDA